MDRGGVEGWQEVMHSGHCSVSITVINHTRDHAARNAETGEEHSQVLMIHVD